MDDAAPGVVALPPVGPAARLDAVRDFAEGRSRQPTWLGDPRLDDPRLSPPGAANTGEVRFTAALSFQDDGSLVVGFGGRGRAGRRSALTDTSCTA